MVWMTDKVLNQIVVMLLETSVEDRVASAGEWAKTLDWAMREWTNRHPRTRPPAYAGIPAPKDCFLWILPPIYEWPLDNPETIH